jgi:hypothetical protein
MENKLKHLQTFEQSTDKNLNISDVSGSYSKSEIIAAWTKCKENRGFGYVVTLQDLLSALG